MLLKRSFIVAAVVITALLCTAVPSLAAGQAGAPSVHAPSFASIPSVLTKSGTGDKVLKFTAQKVPTVAKITNRGGSNFAIVAYTGSAYDDLLVNEIGSYAGTVYIAPGVNLLKLTSSGAWTVDIKPYTAARKWNGRSEITGKGDAVVLLTGGAFASTTIKNKGRSNFAVIAYGTSGEYLDLLVNEIGSYSGEVLLPDASPIILSIHAAGGTWSFSRIG